jgi:four helix bundle protein
MAAAASFLYHVEFHSRNNNCHQERMNNGTVRSDQLEERLIEFAAEIVRLSMELPASPAGRHIAQQMLRSGTAPAPNYAEVRGAESRADFIHKLGIVQKELNETCVWLRLLLNIVAEKPENIVGVIAENRELARIVTASIKTAQKNARVPRMAGDR